MKTGEAAKILGVDRTTIINWIENRGLEQFFSDQANGRDGGTQRTLTESDLLVLNTIRARRAENLDWPHIARFLETGQRENEVPQNAASTDKRTVPVQQAEMSARALATVAERDQALQRVDELTEQVTALMTQLKDAHEQELKLMREIADLHREAGGRELLEQEISKRDSQIEAQNRKLEDLSRQIGKLEGQLEFYRETKSRNGTAE